MPHSSHNAHQSPNSRIEQIRHESSDMSGSEDQHTYLMCHPSPDLYGSDRVFLAAVQGLVAAGHRVVVSLPQPGRLSQALEGSGAHVRYVPSPVLRRAYMSPSGLVQLAKESYAAAGAGLQTLREVRPDTVYVSTVTLPLWPLLAKVTGTRIVSHVHEAEDNVNPVLWWALTRGAELSDAVIVNSRFTARVLAKAAPLAARKARLVFNPVSVSNDPATDPRENIGKDMRLVYVGRLSQRKGVHVAIDALHTLVERGLNPHLDIVGDVFAGYEWYEEQLHKQVAHYGLQDRVTWHGFHADVTHFLDDADIAVVPAVTTESFGNTVVETLLRKRPVVVSNHSGLQEAGRPFKNVRWVAPEDAQVIADAVQDLADTWSAVREHASQDAALAQRRHDPERFGEHVAAVVRTGGLAPSQGNVVSPAPAVVLSALTYRRNELIPHLVESLGEQAALLDPPAQVLIVDNDPDGSARTVAEPLLQGIGRYVYHGAGGIAEGRNRVLDEALDMGADAVVIIDDDETPSPRWLPQLVERFQLERPGAVVGPVVPEYLAPVPRWIEQGKFFVTMRRPTGSLVPMAATNNLLLDMGVIVKEGLRFDTDFSRSGGSDSVLTWQLANAGYDLVWVDEATVGDRVPASRMTREWLMKRAFRLSNCYPFVDERVNHWTPADRVKATVKYLAGGAVRVGAGTARFAYGLALQDRRHQGRGLRTMVRGLGYVSGAVGYKFHEYKPKTKAHSAAPASQAPSA